MSKLMYSRASLIAPVKKRYKKMFFNLQRKQVPMDSIEIILKSARSQNQFKISDGNQQLYQMERQLPQRKIKEKARIIEKKVSEEELQKLKNNSYNRGIRFASSIVDSQQVSLDQFEEDIISEQQRMQQENKHKKPSRESDSQFNAYAERKKKELLKPLNLNIILLGKTGIGKTSFIDCFFNRKNEYKNIIKQKTKGFDIQTGTRSSDNFQIKVNFIDFYGYSQTNAIDYTKEVSDYIDKKYIQCIQKKDRFQREKKIYEQNEDVDTRIHCCLYFLSGPRVEESDWKIMRQIHRKVNIIPIIGKGDTYSSIEIKQFKKIIHERQKKQRLELFNGEEILRQKFPDKLNYLLSGPFGKAPPFVITTCTENKYAIQKGRMELVREYYWGTIHLENQNHTDFLLLKKMLIAYFSDALIRLTDIIERGYLEQMIEERVHKREESYDSKSKSQDNFSSQKAKQSNFPKKIFYGTAVVSMFLTAYFFNKKFKN